MEIKALKNQFFHKTKFLVLFVLCGFFVSIFYHFLISTFLGLNFYPFNTFLFNPVDRFNDFFNIYNATKGLNPYAYDVSVYFPVTFLIMYFFTFLDPFLAIVLFFIIFVFFFVWYISKNSDLVTALVFLFVSYPVLFLCDRANVESWLFVFLGLFIYFYQKKRFFISLIFLSLAISLKLYPIVFIFLFILDRKYLYVLYTFLVSAFMTVFSASILKGGIVASFSGLSHRLSSFDSSYVQSVSHGLQHNSSFFALFKVCLYGFFGLFKKYFFLHINFDRHEYVFSIAAQNMLNIFYRSYFVFAFLFFCFILFIVWKEKIFWKRMALLVFAMILLPQISYDYKLIHIFIPMFLFINFKEKDSKDIVYATLFGLLLIPKDYIILFQDVSIAVILNPLIMIIFVFLIAYNNLVLKKETI